MPSDMAENRNCEIMALTADGFVKLGAPVDIKVEHDVERIPGMPYLGGSSTATLSLTCHPSVHACNSVIKSFQLHKIRQWLGGNYLGCGDYTPRWTEHAEESMQVFPTKVICNPPATIAFWDDGTKTVAKTSESRYDPYVGLLCCIVKHVGASALKDGESVNGRLNRILVDAGMRYQVPSKFGKHWVTKEFGRFSVIDAKGKTRNKWVEIAGSES